MQIEEIDVLLTMVDGKFTYQGNGEASEEKRYSDHCVSPAEMNRALVC
jgi:hypothetical protein